MSPPETLEAASVGPLVSVVVPTYNVEPYIEQAVVSALDQTWRSIEVIVVNDGSTDGSRAVVERLMLERRDPRLRLVDRPNGGLSAARNTGLAEALGDYIAFLDSDDAWRPDKLARHMRLLLARPEVGLTFSLSEYMTEDGRLTGDGPVTTRQRPLLHDMLRRNHCGNGSTVVLRRDCIEQAGNFREELTSCEDYELWCRILWATPYEAVCIPERLTLYRQRETSLSFNVGKFVRNADLAMQRLRELMPNVPRRCFRAGHAEHYRIAASRAASSGQDAAARRLLLHALRLRPSLVVTDFRALATAVALLLPGRLRGRLAIRAKAVLCALRRREA